ncbi:MAG: malonyl-CoA decarboxylase [Devosia sp.]
MTSSFLQDLLWSVAERGRHLIDMGRDRSAIGTQPLDALSEALVSARGEASGMAIAQEILLRYNALSAEQRTAYLTTLAKDFGPDRERLDQAISAYRADPDDAKARAIHDAAEPRRQDLLRRLNMAPQGTEMLVKMRTDLLAVLTDAPWLGEVDEDFRHLFSSWFNRGFLVMRRVDWQTPAAILEKIIHYEAVHEIADWNDLRRRIDPPDRRLYAFFHPALADEPLIFVEVALCIGTPAAIGPLLSASPPADADKVDTAVFYSISNCQAGLSGISFGSFLIKQVAEELARENPKLTTFVTLSPLPGFRAWLSEEGRDFLTGDEQDRLSVLDAPDWPVDETRATALKDLLLPLAAHYLLFAKTARGRPPDPVARFHLGNGASLERINWLGDPGSKGLRQAAGLMVNYRYVLKDIERNHEAYALRKEVVSAQGPQRLLRTDLQHKTLVPAQT